MQINRNNGVWNTKHYSQLVLETVHGTTLDGLNSQMTADNAISLYTVTKGAFSGKMQKRCQIFETVLCKKSV
jgi:hypothetical protein